MNKRTLDDRTWIYLSRNLPPELRDNEKYRKVMSKSMIFAWIRLDFALKDVITIIKKQLFK